MTATKVASGALVSNAATVTFAARYNYLEVKNLDTTGTNFIYVRTDGVAPASTWADCYVVGPGERVVVPNDLPMWWQGFGGPNDPTGSSNPGSSVKLAGVAATSPYEVAGIG